MTFSKLKYFLVIIIMSLSCNISAQTIAEERNISEISLKKHSLSWGIALTSQTLVYEYGFHRNHSLIVEGGFGISTSLPALVADLDTEYGRVRREDGWLFAYKGYYSFIYSIAYRYYFYRWQEEDMRYPGYSNSGFYLGARWRGTSSVIFPIRDAPDVRYDPLYKYGVVVGVNNEFGSRGQFYFNGQVGWGTQFNGSHRLYAYFPMVNIIFGVHLFQKA